MAGEGAGVVADWLSVLAGLGLSLKHPTPIEQTSKSAANTSVLVVLSKLVLPQTSELRIAGLVRDALLLNRLMRVMVGHLLLLSSTGEIAGRWPNGEVLILLGLERLDAQGFVVSRTQCGVRNTAESY
jgi:hypothetical protein